MAWDQYPECLDPDPALLEQAEREAMIRPEPCSMWDSRLYTTHAPVISWAVNSGEFLDESNYATVTENLTALATECGDDTLVIEGTIQDWAVGQLRQTFVRVRDDAGAFTPVWKRAVGIALYLRDRYPVFDEDDYVGRERDWWDSQVQAEMQYAVAEYEDVDGEDLHRKLRDTAIGELSASGVYDYHETPAPAEMVDAYRHVRDTYYAEIGASHLAAQIEGQGVLAL